MEGYHLPPVAFTENKANALITIEQLAIKNKDQSLSENVSSAIEKIKAILRYSQKGNADLLADRVYFGADRKFKTKPMLKFFRQTRRNLLKGGNPHPILGKGLFIHFNCNIFQSVLFFLFSTLIC